MSFSDDVSGVGDLHVVRMLLDLKASKYKLSKTNQTPEQVCSSNPLKDSTRVGAEPLHRTGVAGGGTVSSDSGSNSAAGLEKPGPGAEGHLEQRWAANLAGEQRGRLPGLRDGARRVPDRGTQALKHSLTN